MPQRIDTITPTQQNLLWLNRNNQQRVVASQTRAGNGALIVEQSVIPSGLPIVIGTKSGGMTRSDFAALQAHNASTLTPFELALGSNTWQVIWDNTSDAAISGDDIFDEVDGFGLITNVQLKFLTAD